MNQYVFSIRQKAIPVAKPFSQNFDEQLDAAEELYGCNVTFYYNKKEVENILVEYDKSYPVEVIGRVRDALYHQMQKYQSYEPMAAGRIM